MPRLDSYRYAGRKSGSDAWIAKAGVCITDEKTGEIAIDPETKEPFTVLISVGAEIPPNIKAGSARSMIAKHYRDRNHVASIGTVKQSDLDKLVEVGFDWAAKLNPEDCLFVQVRKMTADELEKKQTEAKVREQVAKQSAKPAK